MTRPLVNTNYGKILPPTDEVIQVCGAMCTVSQLDFAALSRVKLIA